jgi:DNA-binding winged helix-turn-helix (wHTH) protein
MSSFIKHLYRFGEFTLDANQKVLLREGKPLPLAPKVLETLLTLVQNGGRIIEKEDLMARLWPDTYVEESNLTYTIVQLRKTLGDDARHPRYIETIPKRGYRFIVEVETAPSDIGSIAVLPFLDMSPERDQGYFCEGLADELINSLASLPNLHVASRTSSLRFKSPTLDIREVGRRLNVKTVLEGSVRKSGNNDFR